MWHWYLFLSYRLLIFAIFLYIASIFKEKERERERERERPILQLGDDLCWIVANASLCKIPKQPFFLETPKWHYYYYYYFGFWVEFLKKRKENRLSALIIFKKKNGPGGIAPITITRKTVDVPNVSVSSVITG